MNPARKHFLTVAAPYLALTIFVGLASLKAICMGGWHALLGVIVLILTLISFLMLYLMDQINQSE